MKDTVRGITISFSRGGKLLAAATEEGQTTAIPMKRKDDSGVRTVNVTAEGDGTDRERRGDRASARTSWRLRLVR